MKPDIKIRMKAMDAHRGKEKIMEMTKWKDTAGHKPGCPYKGVPVSGTAAEMAKYHSGYCPGCNIPVKWEEEKR
jgi:hypothetical protein